MAFSTQLRGAVLGLAVLVAGMALPNSAAAQYKNNTFGLDVGYWRFTQPSLQNSDGSPIPASRRPMRFSHGYRFGGESSFKMNTDHWWFSVGVDVNFLQFSGDSAGTLEEQFDALAADELGTLLGLEAGMGLRYVFLTDRFRPYLQAGLSYMRLFTLTSGANDQCVDTTFCDGTLTNSNALLTTQNVGALHIQPGAEIILERDIALHLYADVQRWIVLNAPDNWAPVFGVGLLFFT